MSRCFFMENKFLLGCATHSVHGHICFVYKLFTGSVKGIADIDTKKLLRCLIVRPQLENACRIWSLYKLKDNLLLETVTPSPGPQSLNYPRDISYRDRLRKLSLLQLEYRRKIQNLVLMYIKLEQIMLITFFVKP